MDYLHLPAFLVHLNHLLIIMFQYQLYIMDIKQILKDVV